MSAKQPRWYKEKRLKGRGQGVARIVSHPILKSNENQDLVLAIENPILFSGARGSEGRED